MEINGNGCFAGITIKVSTPESSFVTKVAQVDWPFQEKPGKTRPPTTASGEQICWRLPGIDIDSLLGFPKLNPNRVTNIRQHANQKNRVWHSGISQPPLWQYPILIWFCADPVTQPALRTGARTYQNTHEDEISWEEQVATDMRQFVTPRTSTRTGAHH